MWVFQGDLQSRINKIKALFPLISIWWHTGFKPPFTSMYSLHLAYEIRTRISSLKGPQRSSSFNPGVSPQPCPEPTTKQKWHRKDKPCIKWGSPLLPILSHIHQTSKVQLETCFQKRKNQEKKTNKNISHTNIWRITQKGTTFLWRSASSQEMTVLWLKWQAAKHIRIAFLPTQPCSDPRYWKKHQVALRVVSIKKIQIMMHL